MAIELTVLAAIRVAAFLAVAPLLGQQPVPGWMRVGLTVVIALALAPLGSGAAMAVPPMAEAGDWLSRAVSELMIGLMLGLGVVVIVEAASMGGQLLAQMAGLSWPASESAEASPASQLVGLLALAVFALLRGPELMLDALAGTLVAIPPGRGSPVGSAEGQLGFVVDLMSQSLWLSLRGVAPAVAAIWMAMLAVTILVRVLPQAGCLQLGLDAGTAVFWLAILLAVCGGVWVWNDDLESWMGILRNRIVNVATHPAADSLPGS